MMDLLFLLALFVQNVAGGNAIGAIGRIGALTIQPPDGSFMALERGSESGTRYRTAGGGVLTEQGSLLWCERPGTGSPP